MPQACLDLANRIRARFGSLSDEGPMRTLTEAGYRLTGDWIWLARPGVTCSEDVPAEEADCILFLIEEWDFGGVDFSRQPAPQEPLRSPC